MTRRERLIAELRQYAQEGEDKPMRLHALERIFRRDFCVAPILLLWYTARAWPNVHMNAASQLTRAISSATRIGALTMLATPSLPTALFIQRGWY